jgi:hypothetical protein
MRQVLSGQQTAPENVQQTVPQHGWVQHPLLAPSPQQVLPDGQQLPLQHAPPLHAVPFAFSGFEQVPVAGLHVPAVWHWSEAVQTTGLLPVQTPAWQVSVWVQASPSSQGVLFAFGGLEHCPVAGLHVPAVWH